MTDNIDDVLDRIEKSEALGEAETESTNALALLRSIYRNPQHPLGVRIRCAVEALPYENPKLSAIGVSSIPAHDFAAALERAIVRSQSPTPAALLPPPEQHPAEEVRKPMARLRRF